MKPTTKGKTKMTAEMKAAIAAMQTKRQPLPRVFQASDGTWRNKYEQQRYADRTSAETAARFCEEWGCK